MKQLQFIACLIWSAASVNAATMPTDSAPNFFVATNGVLGSSGRLASPISYSELTTNVTSTLKTNGAIFWMRGGTYPFTVGYVSLQATGITVRPYPGETVVIQDGWNVQQSNTIRGLNFMCPLTVLTVSNAYPNGENNFIGLNFAGPGIRSIGNNVIGFPGGHQNFSAASNTLNYGDVILSSGINYTNGGNSNHGHGLYAQNHAGTKRYSLCHFLFSTTSVATFHGTDAASINNIYFQSNFVCGSSSIGLISQDVTYDFEISHGDTAGITNCWVTDNFIIQDSGDGASGSIPFGAVQNPPNTISGINQGSHLDRNYIKGGILAINDYDDFSIRSNVIWSTSSSQSARIVTTSPTISYPALAIDDNDWFYTGGNGHPWFAWTNYQFGVTANNISITSFPMWQSMVHGDTNGTYTAAAPTTIVVKVWTNALRDEFDQWWGDIAVWNPGRSNSVSVELTGLPAGNRVDIKYTGAMLSNAVVTAVYDGSSISVPLMTFQTYQPTDASWPRTPIPTNGASFRVFLVGNNTLTLSGQSTLSGKVTLQ